MSDKEKKIIEKICDSVKNAPEAKKEYMLGVMEGMALMSAMKAEEPKVTEAN